MDVNDLRRHVHAIIGRWVDWKDLRGMLRCLFPSDAPGRGGQWELSRRQVELVETCFRRLRAYESESRYLDAD